MPGTFKDYIYKNKFILYQRNIYLSRSIILIWLLSFLLPFNALSLTPGIQQDTVSQKKVTFKQPVYTTQRLTTPPPVIDGKLDDLCWKKGNWAGDFIQWMPNEGAKPTYPTELNIQYDDRNLYVAIRAFDGEPKKIIKRSGVRDEHVGDMAGVAFDSNHDFRTGFEFSVTSWGQKIDVIIYNPLKFDMNWDAVWNVKTGMEDSAWVAEYQIPLSQLRYSNKKEQVWGMHAWRSIARLSEYYNWEKQRKNSPGMLYDFGELRGIDDLRRSRRIEIMPFVLGKLNTIQTQPGNPFTKNGMEWAGNAGLDAKIGVSSNFTINLTVNPDFGQVESDPSVMNLTAFETFYQEKRPFFLEGLTIFDYMLDDQSLFYSRRIGHAPSLILHPNDTTFIKSSQKTTILSALKFSGTTSKGLSIGLIHSITARERAQIGTSDDRITTKQVEPLTSYTVARIQKGYRSGNTIIGGMITSVNRSINDPDLDFLTRNAYTGGLDLLHYWRNKEYYVDARLLGSSVNGSRLAVTALQESSARYYQRPDAGYLRYDTSSTKLNGYGGRFKIGRVDGIHWQYYTGVSWLSPGLELNDIGYLTIADQIKNDNYISYQTTKTISIFHDFSFGLNQFNLWNFNGVYLGSGARLDFTSEYINNWTFNTSLVYNTNSIDTRLLRGGPQMRIPFMITELGTASTDQSRNIIFNFSYSYQVRGDKSGNSYYLMPGISVRPLQVLKIGVTTNIANNHDVLQYVTTLNYMSGKRYIFGTINEKTVGLTFSIDLNLSPKFSIQYYGNPFIARGAYSEFKYITDPSAKRFGDRFKLYDYGLQSMGDYALDENIDGIADYNIANPDFNFQQFRSNLVAKWEYRLGSFIYLVWSGDRTTTTASSGSSYKQSLNQLMKIFPNNIFLIKLSYWFNP
jgi:hypothetical protein